MVSLYLLLKETANICIENKAKASLINHSAYWIGKILDTLRILTMIHSEATMPSVYIQELHWDRLNKITDYLIHEDSKYFILLGREIDSIMLSKYQIFQIESWLAEDGVYGGLELLYWGSRDEWKASDSHYKCDNKGETVSVIQSIGGFIFGGFSDKPWTSSSDK